MMLSIIILNYNTKDLTIACVESVFKYYKERFETGEFELILVDNASSDDSVNEIKKIIASVKNTRIIESKENYGFAKGNNIGAQYAKSEYLLFLNSDTQFLDKGILNMLTFLKERPKIGILGGRLHNNDGSNQRSVGNFFNIYNTFLMLFLGERFGFVRYRPYLQEKVDWVSGACMMISKELFSKLNGFDENIFMYIEDVEICYRAQKKGFSTWFFPAISIVHQGHGSSSRTFAIINIYKGLLYFFKKHKGVNEYVLAKSLLSLKARLAIIIGKTTRNIYLKNAYQKALDAII